MYINQFLKIIHTSVKIKCQVKVGKMRGVGGGGGGVIIGRYQLVRKIKGSLTVSLKSSLPCNP